MGDSKRRQVALVLGLGALVSGVAGARSDDGPPESKRKCAVVQAGELSEILDVDVELEPVGEDRRVCAFASEDERTVVTFTIDGPVEASLTKLLLTDPSAIDDVGDEAWYSRRDVPLDARATVRDGGSMVTIDLRATGVTERERRATITEIAKASVDGLPEHDLVKADGARGDDACSAYDTTEVAEALGAVPTVEPVLPPGSCELAVAAEDLSARVNVLVDKDATAAQLERIVGAVESPQEVDLDGSTAYWVTPPSGESTGGQLSYLDDDRLLQVSVIGVGLADGEALGMATAVATAGLTAD